MTLAPELPGHRTSWLGQRDPRWRMGALSVWAIAASLVNGLAGASIAFGGSIVILIAAQLPWRWSIRRLFAIFPFLLLLIVPLLVWHGRTAIQPATILMFKALAVVLPMIALVGLTATSEMLDALRSMRLPGRVVSLILLAELYGIVLSTVFNRTRRAMCVRGFHWQTNRHTYRTVGNAIGSIAVRGMDRSQRVGQALACRGFDGEYRSWRTYQTTIGDVGCVLFALAAGVVLVVWDWQQVS